MSKKDATNQLRLSPTMEGTSTTSDKKKENPSVFACERKLSPSDGIFFSGNWEGRKDSGSWPPVPVTIKAVRGTISNRLNSTQGKDSVKKDPKVESPNPQVVDVAMLPQSADTLKVCFSLRILGGLGYPTACNQEWYSDKLQQIVADYISQTGMSELALRYAYNLANGRFLWRNRVGSEAVEVIVRHLSHGEVQHEWIFDQSLDFSLRNFPASTHDLPTPLSELAAVIQAALSGDSHALLEVTAFACIGKGQEVFPSQDMIMDRTDGKSKTLYVVGGAAGMHSQKIGNALRTIDDWHPEGTFFGPISIDSYGAVTTLSKSFRKPSEHQDFYTLLDNWVHKDKKPSLENQHYVMAMFIRGGVFSDGKKESKKNAKEDS